MEGCSSRRDSGPNSICCAISVISEHEWKALVPKLPEAVWIGSAICPEVTNIISEK
jgi:hypothetical protein